MDDYIKEVANSLDFDGLNLVKINNNIFLTKHEVEILSKYHIDYQNCNDMHMLMYLIDECLDECSDAGDLENVSLDIAERNYYMNTNK